MSSRELIVLGTSSQVPTRYRNHNGYFLRWDALGLLFDPGEGTQRQLILAGLPSRSIQKIFVTHFHGDHALGLPGILQRLNLDRAPHPVEVYYPAEDERFFLRLRDATHYDRHLEILPMPVHGEHWKEVTPEGWTIEARRLDHPVPTYGYRIQEPMKHRFSPEKLRETGLRGSLVGQLAKNGKIEKDGREILLGEVADVLPGMAFAFVMDTRPCPAAVQLAHRTHLAVLESTYLESEAHLAHSHFHSTAAQAAQMAAEAGCEHLVLSHFSQRYERLGPFLREAGALHPRVSAPRDLERISIPWGRRTRKKSPREKKKPQTAPGSSLDGLEQGSAAV